MALAGLRCERGFDVGADRLGRVVRRVALEHLAVAADQELGEVPLDRLGAEQARRLGLQPVPQRVRLSPLTSTLPSSES
jgi:hypothetical protein